MPILKNIATNLEAAKFRVRLAILDSELAQTLVDRARALKAAGQIVLTDPRRLIRAIFKRLSLTTSTQVGEPVSQKLLLKSTPSIKPYSPKSGLPIVFIHTSNSDHLRYSLAQAHKSNPESDVILIGDSSNDVYDFVEHRPMTDYFHGAQEFAKIYKHYSTHGIRFELICFQRWFILREFLETHGIPHCLYLDSDIMLYADVTTEYSKFKQFDFTLCWNTIGCVFFLNRVEGLDEFCQFLMDIYSGKNRFYYDRMVAHYTVRKKHRFNGGACDMTAFQLYSEGHFGQIGEASYVIDGSVYDPNINMPHPGFEMENGIKKVTWKGRQPYGRYLRTGEQVRFNSLHFNGRAKKLMSQYYVGHKN